MSRLLFILCLLLSAATSPAQSLRWERDTLTLSQHGCDFEPDSGVATFTNTSSSTITLESLRGASSAWQVVDAKSYEGLSILPGQSRSLTIRLLRPSNFSNDILIVKSTDGSADTLHLRQDLQIARLAHGWGDLDTMRLSYLYDTGDEYTVFSIMLQAVGKVPFVIDSIALFGSDAISINASQQDTIEPMGIPGRVEFIYKPVTVGADTATIIVMGSPCEEPLTFTLIVRAQAPRPLAWDWNHLNLRAPCKSNTQASVNLINKTDLPTPIDSVVIRGNSSDRFAFADSTRLKNFVLANRSTISYLIQYEPTGTGNDSALLIAYSSSIRNDTVRLYGYSSSSRLTAQSSAIDLGPIRLGDTVEQSFSVRAAGSLSYVVSAIDLEGELGMSLSGITIGDTIRSANRLITVAAIPNKTGSATGSITIRGTECDSALTIVVSANVSEQLSVATETAVEVIQTGRTMRLVNVRGDMPSYSVCDLSGRLVESATIPGDGVLRLDHLIPGMYILDLKRTDLRSTRKIVIQ